MVEVEVGYTSLVVNKATIRCIISTVLCLRLLRETEDWVPSLLWLLPVTSQREGRGGVPGGVWPPPGLQIFQLQVSAGELLEHHQSDYISRYATFNSRTDNCLLSNIETPVQNVGHFYA